MKAAAGPPQLGLGKDEGVVGSCRCSFQRLKAIKLIKLSCSTFVPLLFKCNPILFIEVGDAPEIVEVRNKIISLHIAEFFKPQVKTVKSTKVLCFVGKGWKWV